jgi:hypothetical protein
MLTNRPYCPLYSLKVLIVKKLPVITQGKPFSGIYMNKNLIMIRTKDKRKLFTAKSNLPSLIEYVKAFRAEVAEVQTTAEPLELKELAKALCDASVSQEESVSIVKEIYPKNIVKDTKPRTVILKEAATVKSWIELQLLAKKVVSLKTLREQFDGMDLSDSTLCNHMTAVRRKLKTQGHIITKTDNGYCVVPEVSYIRPDLS